MMSAFVLLAIPYKCIALLNVLNYRRIKIKFHFLNFFVKYISKNTKPESESPYLVWTSLGSTFPQIYISDNLHCTEATPLLLGYDCYVNKYKLSCIFVLLQRKKNQKHLWSSNLGNQQAYAMHMYIIKKFNKNISFAP